MKKWNICVKYDVLLCLILFVLGSNNPIHAQDNKKNAKLLSPNNAALNLSKSLEMQQVDNEKLAKDYEDAAKEALSKEQSDIAENYFTKAREIYNKLKQKEKIAELDREIAKLQEQKKEYDKAFLNYQSASENAVGGQKIINSNDAQRLNANTDLVTQSHLLQSNIALASQSSDLSSEVSFANRQMAQVNAKLNNKDAAVANLKDALHDAKSTNEKIAISKEMNALFVNSSTQNYSTNTNTTSSKINKNSQATNSLAGKSINSSLTAQVAPTNSPITPEVAKQTSTDIQTTSNSEEVTLESTISKKTKEVKQGVRVQEESSTPQSKIQQDLATSLHILLDTYYDEIKNSHTLEANKILNEITNIYIQQNEYDKAIDLYYHFSENLPVVLAKDSTVQDPQIYVLINERIKELEKNRAMNELLMKRKNTINYVLVIVILLVIIILIVVLKSLHSIRQKNKRIALQSLRREMNPHFIFNSLNSVNQFIAENNELEANKYLSSYSKLMRTMMENSNNDFIPLSTELLHLQKYLELEYMRFNDKFEYQINIDASIDPDTIMVPNMLLQPHLENAIWHGLRYTASKGLLTLSVKEVGSKMEIRIEDNGIGLEKSDVLKTNNQRKQTSRGVNNTRERINLLNSLYHTDINLAIIDKDGESTGVIVILTFEKRFK